MPLGVRCPGCQASLALPDGAAGKQARCPRCQKVFLLPAPKPKPPEAELLQLVDEPQPRRDAIRTKPVPSAVARPEKSRGEPVRVAAHRSVKRNPSRALPMTLAVVGGLFVLGALGSGAWWFLRPVQPASPPKPDEPQTAAAEPNARPPGAGVAPPGEVPHKDNSAPAGAQPEVVQGAPDDRPAVPPVQPVAKPPVRTEQPALVGDGKLPPATLAALKAGTVFVKVDFGRLQATGSGFLMKVDGNTGYVVTNDHVISPLSKARAQRRVTAVFWSGTKKEKVAPAQVLATDSHRDLAILKVTGLPEFPAPLNLEDKPELTETMSVWILGFPFGDLLSATRGNPSITIGKGTVSSIRNDEYDETKIVQVDGDVNPGNSGGPVVDGAGRLVGVTVAKIAGTRIGLAIPPIELTKMLNGRVGAVGFRTVSNDDSSAEMEATASLIDPLNKITAVAVLYAPADAAGTAPQRGADGLFPPLPGAQRVNLVIADQKARTTFKVAAAPGTAFLFQTVYTNGEGKTIYTGVGKFVAAPKLPEMAKRPPSPSGHEPAAKDTNEDLGGAARVAGGLKITETKLQTRDAAPCMLWADGGKTFYFLERNGIVRRIALADFKEERQVDLGRKASWLSMSSQGLLVALPDEQAAWLLDPKTFQVKAKMDAPSVTHALSAPSLSVGFAFNHQGDAVHVLDLKAGKTIRQYGPQDFGQPVGLAKPVITPDGKYIFTTGGIEQVFRLRISGMELKYEEASPRIIQGRFEGLCVSDDSRFICAPCGGGNYTGLPNHPQATPYSTYIYPVANLHKPAFVLNQGAYPQAVGFDAKAGLVYSQNFRSQLIVFSDKGIKLKEYTLPCGGVRQYLVHPDGRKLMVLGDAKLLLAELTEK